MGNTQIYKSALESMLYVWGEPLSIKAAADVLGIEYDRVKELFIELKDEYEKDGRGIRIRQINRSFQMVTSAENAIFIKRLCTPVKSSKLSQAALEVLAIIAYKQPVTKAEIEAIRGVRGTTDVFLKQFGFASISELPPFQDLEGVLSDEEIEDSSSTQQLKLKI